MKVLVTGVTGQLGHDVVNELMHRGNTVICAGHNEMDITDSTQVSTFIKNNSPDVVMHCAAWTAVDLAEERIDDAMAVNAIGTQNIADACKNINCKMIYISTDYVFDGNGNKPWKPDDTCNPLNIYGSSKYKGELAVQNTLEKYFCMG